MSRARAVQWVSCLALCLALSSSAWAHRFFVSLAEMDYDSDRMTVEVSLRVDDHNLEDALRGTQGRSFRLTADATGERAAQAYVAQRFQLATPGGDPLPLKWVGWEWSTDATWIYFEIPVPGKASGLELSNTLFIELSDQQINTVNFRHGETRETLTFDRKSRIQSLSLPLP